MLKHVLLAACLALPLAAVAADDKKEMTPQQQRMATCNKEAAAKTLKGDDRKKFMSECLSGGTKKVTQQEKMGLCNKEAGEKKLTGDERKKFMSTCLSA
jgi:hypothetical protein